MKRILIIIFGLIISVISFTSCEEETIRPNDSGSDNPDIIPATKDVTYLIYMVGENDLSGLLKENIEDLITGFKKAQINANVLVYADITKTPELYLLHKKDGNVTKKTVKTYSDQYSVNPYVMREVIKGVLDAYPANKYAITFSSHANGSLYSDNVIRKRSFGYEGSSGYSMNITDIRFALKSLPKFELIMFDACMMSNIETAYEFKDLTQYILSAPNSVPGEGFPYDKILPSLLELDGNGISQAAASYMSHFKFNDVDWDNFAAISVCDVSKIDSLAIYMDSLFQDPISAQRPETLDSVKFQMYESDYPLFDFGHWVDSVGKDNKYLKNVRKALNEVVIYKSHGGYASVNDYTGNLIIPIDDKTFSGLNTYVPSTLLYKELEYKSYFTTLMWYKEAGLWRCPLYNWYEQ